MICGDTYILEYEGADEEAVEVVKRIKGAACDTGSCGEGGEGGGEVYVGTGDGGRAERAAQESDVGLLIVGDLVEDLLLRCAEIGDLGTAGNGSWPSSCQARRR